MLLMSVCVAFWCDAVGVPVAFALNAVAVCWCDEHEGSRGVCVTQAAVTGAAEE